MIDVCTCDLRITCGDKIRLKSPLLTGLCPSLNSILNSQVHFQWGACVSATPLVPPPPFLPVAHTFLPFLTGACACGFMFHRRRPRPHHPPQPSTNVSLNGHKCGEHVGRTEGHPSSVPCAWPTGRGNFLCS